MAEEKNYKGNLHDSARKSTFKNANDLRRNETPAEKKLWQYLRNRQLKGRKFRRQHAFDKFVLDFYCHECKLAIELDGRIHDKKMNRLYDVMRSDELSAGGIRVLRFQNEEVINEIEDVLKRIEEYL